MRTPRNLSTFDRAGVVVVTLLGACLGGMIATAMARGNDITITPTLDFIIPGLPIGMPVSRMFGLSAGIFASALSNGAAYGLILYGWDRLANAMANRIPTWFRRIAVGLSAGSGRRYW